MIAKPVRTQRVKNYGEIKPLIALCKSGKLFEVGDWITAGKPINAPPIPAKGRRGKTPLEVAIDTGFHSLIEVLLDGGAAIEPEGWDSPMNRALRLRRFDIVKLLVEHGFDPKSVDMQQVFESWDPEIMTYFIERGADVESGKPFAFALSNRIRTALGVFKRYRVRLPSIDEQANIALRHHCKDGNTKWISLLLWAGADPYKLGADAHDEELDGDYEGLSALGFAALYGHYDIFKMRQVRLDPGDPRIRHIVQYLCSGEGVELLGKLLERGLDPNDQENGGCSAIQHCLTSLDWGRSLTTWNGTSDIWHEFDGSREKMKAIHLLAKHGARWAPEDKDQINAARRCLLSLPADYSVEFVWIMSKYKACEREHVENLLRTPRIKSHVASKRERLEELASSWS